MSGHTPGPWRAVRQRVAYCLGGSDCSGGHDIEATFVQPISLQFSSVSCELSKPGNGFIHPDARLIAAAPDLLEACRLIHEQLYGEPMTWVDQVLWQNAAEAVKAAIAKAEGR